MKNIQVQSTRIDILQLNMIKFEGKKKYRRKNLFLHNQPEILEETMGSGERKLICFSKYFTDISFNDINFIKLLYRNKRKLSV